MITARIGHDHFLIWRCSPVTAASLVPGLTPVIEGGSAFLLFAAAEFPVWRWHGLPGFGPLRVAGWLIPCCFRHQGQPRIGNAFLHRYLDHRFLPRMGPRIRVNQAGLRAGGIAAGQRRDGPIPAGLDWFTATRCGLLRRPDGWHHWPIAKEDWSWQAHAATLQAPWADALEARPVGMITVSTTLARWGVPEETPLM